MQIKGLISYYRECFKADSSDFNLRNLLRLKNEDLLFLSGTDEIAAGTLHRLPIDPECGKGLSKRIELYQRERVLLYVSLFVSGKLKNDGDTTLLFSPLVVNEAKLESDEYGYYFSVETSSPSVNEDLLSLLLPEQIDLLSIDNNRIYDPAFWSGLLAHSPYELNYMDGLRFPSLASKTDATNSLRRKNPSLMPISCLAFVERSTSSRGILHELSKLENNDTLSAPLYSIFNKQKTKPGNCAVNHQLVPGTLSASQKKILEIAANQTLGVVSGPPGTGKSYTIAAIAAEHFTRKQSVLIVANSDTALDVIADKLCKDFGLDNLYVRVGQKEILKEFKQYLDDLLAGYFDHSEATQKDYYKEHLNKLVKQIEALENRLLQTSKKAFSRGNRAHKIETGSANIWDKLIHQISTNSIQRNRELWELSEQFNNLINEKENHTKQYLRAEKAEIIADLLKLDRKAIQTLNKASRARTSSKQLEYFESANFKSLLKGFPVWIVTLNTLHKVLPFNSEMFDLVIVDEATQCNIASVLPALNRAKRALIVGDQKQLRHYSFLSRSKQTNIANQFGLNDTEMMLNYRDNSILDLALHNVTSQEQVTFLDEHFRSQPELIDFSNIQFYSNRLKIMQHRPCSTIGHVTVFDVKGERSSVGVNQAEAKAIIDEISSIISEDATQEISRTIGVLSPFSKQVNYITSQVEKHIALENIQAHQIKVATPYGFQGEERDIMLLSFCIDENSKRAAGYLNKPDVFNVSITRARQKQKIYKSVDINKLPIKNLLRKYLASVDSFIIEHKSNQQPDEFQNEVITSLQHLNVECWRGYEMLGTYIDVLVRGKKSYIAIDLIGYPGPWQDYFELDTYKVLKRAGVDVLPLSYALWLQDRDACLFAIKKAIESE